MVQLKGEEEITPISEYGVRYNIWEYATGFDHTTSDKIAKKHPALYPEKLVEDHLKSWSKEGDVVLDPFIGGGTTAKVAMQLNRNYIGFDISDLYVKIARKRCSEHPTVDKWI